uniref:NADH dehydrogenase [ubiquinone] 1 beta subcomplex subunit 9 n=1 Tax=Ditylenchus dipsaci TaxID=166011 RepID=A0A915EFW3_9BILA
MDSPSWMFTKALSHRQKVMRLYKRALREMDAWFSKPGLDGLLENRYERVVMRARFDANKDEKDARKASLLLADGCRQLWQKKHWKPVTFPTDPGGSQFDREYGFSETNVEEYTYPDMEQFPYYFNRREQRKKELLEQWHKIEKAWDDEIASLQTVLPEGPEEKKEVGQK